MPKKVIIDGAHANEGIRVGQCRSEGMVDYGVVIAASLSCMIVSVRGFEGQVEVGGTVEGMSSYPTGEGVVGRFRGYGGVEITLEYDRLVVEAGFGELFSEEVLEDFLGVEAF